MMIVHRLRCTLPLGTNVRTRASPDSHFTRHRGSRSSPTAVAVCVGSLESLFLQVAQAAELVAWDHDETWELTEQGKTAIKPAVKE